MKNVFALVMILGLVSGSVVMADHHETAPAADAHKAEAPMKKKGKAAKADKKDEHHDAHHGDAHPAATPAGH